MFSANDLIDIMLSDELKSSKKEKYLYKVLTSEDFYGWMFNPPMSMNIEKTKENIYNAMTRNKSLKILWSCLRDYDPDDFPRTAAVFIFSLCNYATDLCNKDAKDIDTAYKNGEIDRNERDDEYERADRRFNSVTKVNELCSKIVERKAKKVSRRTGLPMNVVTEAFKTVPEEYYLTRKKIGYYLNIVNTQLYSSIDDIDSDISDIDWSEFFRPLFGVQNETEVAMLLCLEGTSRIAKEWKNLNRIHKIWDSLTGYSLEVLEKTDVSSRAHMLDVYTKIVATMNESNKKDLRVDLTTLDRTVFPNISRSVDAIRDKIKEAVKAEKPDEGVTVS